MSVMTNDQLKPQSEDSKQVFQLNLKSLLKISISCGGGGGEIVSVSRNQN